jgi:hypothetical protein
MPYQASAVQELLASPSARARKYGKRRALPQRDQRPLNSGVSSDPGGAGPESQVIVIDFSGYWLPSEESG